MGTADERRGTVPGRDVTADVAPNPDETHPPGDIAGDPPADAGGDDDKGITDKVRDAAQKVKDAVTPDDPDKPSDR
jgi:hypothetical protein